MDSNHVPALLHYSCILFSINEDPCTDSLHLATPGSKSPFKDDDLCKISRKTLDSIDCHTPTCTTALTYLHSIETCHLQLWVCLKSIKRSCRLFSVAKRSKNTQDEERNTIFDEPSHRARVTEGVSPQQWVMFLLCRQVLQTSLLVTALSRRALGQRGHSQSENVSL